MKIIGHPFFFFFEKEDYREIINNDDVDEAFRALAHFLSNIVEISIMHTSPR